MSSKNIFEKFTKLQIAEVHAEAKLLGYCNTERSRKEQQNAKARILCEILVKCGIPAEVVSDPFEEYALLGYKAVKVLDAYAVYDRSGYCSEELNLDQVGIFEMYSALFDEYSINAENILLC